MPGAASPPLPGADDRICLSTTSTIVDKTLTFRSVSTSLQPSGSGKEGRPGRERLGWLSLGMAGGAAFWDLTCHLGNVDECGRVPRELRASR